MMWLLACVPSTAHHREVKPMAPEAAPEALAAAELPPADWGLNAWPGPGPVGAPEVAWEYHLGVPVVWSGATDGRALYLPAGDRVLRVDTDGSIAWSVDADVRGQLRADIVGIWVGDGDRLKKLKNLDGRVMTDLEGGGTLSGSPVLYNDELAWAVDGGSIGSSAGWTVEAGISSAGGISTDGLTIWLATEEGEAIAVRDGEQVWLGLLGGPAQERAAFNGDQVLVLTAPYEDVKGAAVCFDSDSGELLWRTELGLKASGPPSFHPRAGWLVAEAGGQLHALDAETGHALWTAETGVGLSTGALLAGDRVYLGSPSGQVVMIDVDDGVRWGVVELDSAVVGGLSVFQGVLTAGLADGRLVGIR